MSDFQAVPMTPQQQAEATRLQRQESLALTVPRGVAVIGCGGVGSWIAYFLALAGAKSLWLFDPDKVSANNLNRFLLPPSAIDKYKSDALAEAIAPIRPDCRVVALGAFTKELANSSHLQNECDWAVVSTDTLASRRLVYEWAERSYYEELNEGNYVRYIEAAAEGEFGSITDSPADFSTPDEVRPGYASVPVWVGPCVQAAAMACTYVLHPEAYRNRGRDFNFRLGLDKDEGRVILTPPLEQPDAVALAGIPAPQESVGAINAAMARLGRAARPRPRS